MSDELRPPTDDSWADFEGFEGEFGEDGLAPDWGNGHAETENLWHFGVVEDTLGQPSPQPARTNIRVGNAGVSPELLGGPDESALVMLEDLAAGRLGEPPQFGAAGWAGRITLIERALSEAARHAPAEASKGLQSRLRSLRERLSQLHKQAESCLLELKDACAGAHATPEREAVPWLRSSLARARACLRPCRIEARLANEVAQQCSQAERCIDDFGLRRLGLGLAAATARVQERCSPQARRDLAAVLSRVALARHAILRRREGGSAGMPAMQQLEQRITRARTVLRESPVLGALRVRRRTESAPTFVPLRGSHGGLRLFTELQHVERYAADGRWTSCSDFGRGLYARVHAKLINLAPARLMPIIAHGDGTFSMGAARPLHSGTPRDAADVQGEASPPAIAVSLDGAPIDDAALALDVQRQIVLWALRHRYLGRDRFRVLRGSDLDNEIGTALGLTPLPRAVREDGSLQLYCARVQPQLARVIAAIRRIGGSAPRVRVALVFDVGAAGIRLSPAFCVETANGGSRFVDRSGTVLPERCGVGSLARAAQLALAFAGPSRSAEFEVALAGAPPGRGGGSVAAETAESLMHGTAEVFDLLARGAGAASLLGVALARGEPLEDIFPTDTADRLDGPDIVDICALAPGVIAGLLFWGAEVLTRTETSEAAPIYSVVNLLRLLGCSDGDATPHD